MSEASLPGSPIQWSKKTAVDPKHRPQVPERPSGTVRREWARWPQEAHLLSADRELIRRFTAEEIAVLQGFPPGWFEVPDLAPRDRIRAAGNAVPPPLGSAIMRALFAIAPDAGRSHVELCAGGGGLALSAVQASPSIETMCLVDNWEPAVRVLRAKTDDWDTSAVELADVREAKLRRFRGVGLLSAGLPCQPWSNAGRRDGDDDPRDLLSQAPGFVADCEPSAFLLENVPGLGAPKFGSYLDNLLERLKRPNGRLRYGVLAGVFNAAQFGVPQVRRRLIVIGLRDGSAADVSDVLLQAMKVGTRKAPAQWLPISKALPNWRGSGDWRRWSFAGVAPDPPKLQTPR
jgi:site-specific DNA-cytosine methylase